MKRRSFVKASMVTTTFSGLTSLTADAGRLFKEEKNESPEYYELREYILENANQQKTVEEYYQLVAIPALNKLGVKNIGVFTEYNPKQQTRLFVLIPYSTVQSLVDVRRALDSDTDYQKKASSYLQAPASAPAYQRIKSSLMESFATFPRLQIPLNKPRLFELRRYESSGEAAGKKKIDMFENLGELEIFKRVGLTPVFFAETLIGEMIPNLTYMITFDDMEEHDRNWKAFGGDSEWAKIKSTPGYDDASIVSRITRTFLIPTNFSQI